MVPKHLLPLMGVAACVVLAACTTPPEVSGVDPSEGLAGSSFTVVGSGFSPESVVRLSPKAPGEDVPVTVTDAGLVTLAVATPADLAPGVYTIVVSQAGTEVRVTDGFTVTPVVKDQPCGKLYTANTVVSLATQEAVIDRFYRDDRRETIRVPLADVVAVDFERIAVKDGLCSVIYLRQGNGERVRFQDDLKVDLKSRAYKLGQDLGKKVKVTREDAAPAPSPAGE